MNFAVTGGAGFIGSHIARRLISDGHHVTVVDNLSRGSISNLKDVYDNVDYADVDIREYSRLNKALRNIDGIFHQAALAYVPNSYGDEDEYRQVNVAGTENIFRISLERGIKTVYASSSTVYGDKRKAPVREDSERRPLNPYGMTKLEAELVAERYIKEGAQIIGLRYFNVVGSGRKQEYAGVVPVFLDQLKGGRPPLIHGDGSQIKDFVFVHDVVQANLAAMASRIRDGFFNIGSGQPISIIDLARLLIRLSGRPLSPVYGDPRPGDAKMCVADVTKAGRLLDWRPSTVMEEGLRNLMVRWGAVAPATDGA